MAIGGAWNQYRSYAQYAVSGIGIRIVMGLSKNTVYTNSFSLNNVMIEI